MTNSVEKTEEIEEEISTMRKIKVYFLLGIVLIVFLFYLWYVAPETVQSSNEKVKP